jgi:hypothetical protein
MRVEALDDELALVEDVVDQQRGLPALSVSTTISTPSDGLVTAPCAPTACPPTPRE